MLETCFNKVKRVTSLCVCFFSMLLSVITTLLVFLDIFKTLTDESGNTISYGAAIPFFGLPLYVGNIIAVCWLKKTKTVLVARYLSAMPFLIALIFLVGERFVRAE